MGSRGRGGGGQGIRSSRVGGSGIKGVRVVGVKGWGSGSR